MTAEHLTAHPEEGPLFAIDFLWRGRPEHRPPQAMLTLLGFVALSAPAPPHLVAAE
jgi:hypothetical protein